MTDEVSWVKWHFSKWLGDPALRMCSLAARGLWADLFKRLRSFSNIYSLMKSESSLLGIPDLLTFCIDLML